MGSQESKPPGPKPPIKHYLNPSLPKTSGELSFANKHLNLRVVTGWSHQVCQETCQQLQKKQNLAILWYIRLSLLWKKYVLVHLFNLKSRNLFFHQSHRIQQPHRYTTTHSGSSHRIPEISWKETSCLILPILGQF